jgi:putative Mn2+ efflux pump MntP
LHRELTVITIKVVQTTAKAHEGTSMRILFLVVIGLACVPAVAEAGMPSVGYTISEAAKMRVETFSFFLAGFLLAALGVKWLWNYLAGEFTSLPRLSYGKALALLTL